MMFQYWIIDLITCTEPEQEPAAYCSEYIAVLARNSAKWLRILVKQVDHEFGRYDK